MKLRNTQYQNYHCMQNIYFVGQNEMEILFENKRILTNNSHDVDFINLVHDVLCVHWNNEQFKVSDLVNCMCTTHSTVNRRFQELFGCTAVEFLKEIRLANASQLLLNPTINISETSYRCGFSDPKYFSRCFRNKYGINPREYRKNLIRKNCSESIQGKLLLEKALELLKKKNDYNPMSFDSFANGLNMSKATLYRRIKTVTGQSPCEFIRKYRLNKSVDMLVLSKKKIKDIALTVGFNDSKHFSRCFSNEFGVSPLSYRRRKSS